MTANESTPREVNLFCRIVTIMALTLMLPPSENSIVIKMQLERVSRRENSTTRNGTRWLRATYSAR